MFRIFVFPASFHVSCAHFSSSPRYGFSRFFQAVMDFSIRLASQPAAITPSSVFRMFAHSATLQSLGVFRTYDGQGISASPVVLFSILHCPRRHIISRFSERPIDALSDSVALLFHFASGNVQAISSPPAIRLLARRLFTATIFRLSFASPFPCRLSRSFAWFFRRFCRLLRSSLASIFFIASRAYARHHRHFPPGINATPAPDSSPSPVSRHRRHQLVSRLLLSGH